MSSCLTTGLTELRAAHANNKGAFYSALLNLSVGTERLLKATLIIDHMCGHHLEVPTRKQLKAYGHDLLKLYDACVRISQTVSCQVPPIGNLETPSREILFLLNDFAQTTRYHNLDALNSPGPSKDPLVHWNEILLTILQFDVSSKSKAKIIAAGTAIASAISDCTVTVMQGLDKQALSTAHALVLPSLHDQAAKHAVLYFIKFLCPLRDLLSDLSHSAYALGVSSPPFPQMQEFLGWLSNDRSYVLAKKRWP